jgi:hypothetical protein
MSPELAAGILPIAGVPSPAARCTGAGASGSWLTACGTGAGRER